MRIWDFGSDRVRHKGFYMAAQVVGLRSFRTLTRSSRCRPSPPPQKVPQRSQTKSPKLRRRRASVAEMTALPRKRCEPKEVCPAQARGHLAIAEQGRTRDNVLVPERDIVRGTLKDDVKVFLVCRFTVVKRAQASTSHLRLVSARGPTDRWLQK